MKPSSERSFSYYSCSGASFSRKFSLHMTQERDTPQITLKVTLQGRTCPLEGWEREKGRGQEEVGRGKERMRLDHRMCSIYGTLFPSTNMYLRKLHKGIFLHISSKNGRKWTFIYSFVFVCNWSFCLWNRTSRHASGFSETPCVYLAVLKKWQKSACLCLPKLYAPSPRSEMNFVPEHAQWYNLQSHPWAKSSLFAVCRFCSYFKAIKKNHRLVM